MIDNRFWKSKRVFLTGHTGFKGSWLCLWLQSMGAHVSGYSLPPPTNPSLFELCSIGKMVNTKIGDVRNIKLLTRTMLAAQPEIVIHLAAQPLVRDSYRLPVETYEINVMGTVNLLEAVRKCSSVKAVVNVTTDKCYENKERLKGYCENEPLGGYDPYSNSKACSELVTAAYRNSYFNPNDYRHHGVAVASARAGNVIGGGDWATDRLIPDCVRAALRKQIIHIRNPYAIRPWQHVLEPLSGYLMLAERLYKSGVKYCGAWNFGPDNADAKSVEWLVKKFCQKWGMETSYTTDSGRHLHEARYLRLNCRKAKNKLGWAPRWNLGKAMDSIVDWTRAYCRGDNLLDVCTEQIEEYSRKGG